MSRTVGDPNPHGILTGRESPEAASAGDPAGMSQTDLVSTADALPDPADARGLDRRRLLGLGVGAGLSAAVGLPAARAARGAAAPAAVRPARARNVIVMVSDGMSQGTWTLAEMASIARHGRPSAWARLLSRPGARRAQSTTHSANSLVTDSAAAGSAWGIGHKVDNGAINVTPDGREHVPLFVRAREAGLRTGLVTTTEITHATPASFAANVVSRADAATIGRQLLDRGIDVLLGGGAVHMPEAGLRAPDIHLVRRADQLAAAAGGAAGGARRRGRERLVGLFADGHLPYELDRPDSVPSLAAMAETAIGRLAGDDAGFILQVEGGRVDHAAHANDAGSLVAEQLAFDEAVAVAMRFAEARDDTLLVLTTDHANANPGLTLYGERGNAAFRRLLEARRSFDWIWSTTATRAGVDATPERMLDSLVSAIRDATGIESTADDRDWLARTVVDRRAASAFDGLASRTAALGQVLADHQGVGFVSVNHTSDMVEVVAAGPGSDALAPLIDNVDLHGLMVEAAGLPG